MKNTVLLKRIATISTGYTLRDSLQFVKEGDVRLLQIKDLPKDNGKIEIEELSQIIWDYPSKPILKANNIILSTRGDNRAYLFTGSEKDNVLVSNQFIIIELNSPKISAEFLVWYLNNAPQIKRYFSMHSRGSFLSMLNIATIKDAPIIIPDYSQQQALLSMYKQAEYETKRYQKLAQLRQEYNQAKSEQILNALQGIHDDNN